MDHGLKCLKCDHKLKSSFEIAGLMFQYPTYAYKIQLAHYLVEYSTDKFMLK